MPPRGSSKLQPYKDELLTQQQQGRSLAYMAKHLAQTYGLAAACSTIADFLKQQESNPAPQTSTEPPPQPLPVDQERYLDQVEVYAEIQASIKVVVDEIANLRASSQVSGEDQAVLAQRVNALSDEQKTMLESTERLTRTLEQKAQTPTQAGISPATLRKIWSRALWFTSFFWLTVFGVGVYFLR